MESKDQVSASDKSVSGLVKGIEMQIRDNFDTLPSVRHDSGSVTEHLEEIKHASDEVGCMPTNDKDTDISSTESSNVFAEAKLEVARDESRNVPVEKEVSSCLLTESSNMSANEEKSDTIPVKVGDISQEKDLSQAKCSEALTGGEKFDTTSIESSYENVVFIEARRTDILASCDNLNEQSSDGGNSGIASEVSQLKALRSLCVMQKETGNLQVDADPINEEIETNGNGESISPDKLQTSSRADETACNESVTIKQTAGDLETTALKNSNNGTAGTTEISSEVNVMDKKSSIPSEIACEENITCITSGPTTKKPNYAYLVSKGSADIRSHSSVKVRHETVGGNVTKENSSIAAKAENLHLKRDEKDTNEQLPTDETAVCETVSNETANVGTSEADPQPGESEDDSERRAFFYMSSCSVPGMGKGWEWPTISSEHHYQRIPRRGECLRNAAEQKSGDGATGKQPAESPSKSESNEGEKSEQDTETPNASSDKRKFEAKVQKCATSTAVDESEVTVTLSPTKRKYPERHVVASGKIEPGGKQLKADSPKPGISATGSGKQGSPKRSPTAPGTSAAGVIMQGSPIRSPTKRTYKEIQQTHLSADELVKKRPKDESRYQSDSALDLRKDFKKQMSSSKQSPEHDCQPTSSDKMKELVEKQSEEKWATQRNFPRDPKSASGKVTSSDWGKADESSTSNESVTISIGEVASGARGRQMQSVAEANIKNPRTSQHSGARPKEITCLSRSVGRPTIIWITSQHAAPSGSDGVFKVPPPPPLLRERNKLAESRKMLKAKETIKKFKRIKEHAIRKNKSEISENNSEDMAVPGPSTSFVSKKKATDITCHVCGRKFASFQNLKRHASCHTCEKPFVCNVCNKSFSREDSRMRHIKSIHIGEEPHICNICNKQLACKRSLDIHQRSHTGDKPHECPVCRKKISDPSGFRKHLRTHTDEKPYYCTICGQNFKYSSSLKQHENNHRKL